MLMSHTHAGSIYKCVCVQQAQKSITLIVVVLLCFSLNDQKYVVCLLRQFGISCFAFQICHYLEKQFCPNLTCLHKSLTVTLENRVEKKYYQKWLVFKSYYNTVNKTIHIFVHEVLNSCDMLRGTGISLTQSSQVFFCQYHSTSSSY